MHIPYHHWLATCAYDARGATPRHARSDSVVFPASMWAITPMFRMRLAGSRTLVVVVAALAPCSALVVAVLLQLLTTTLRATDTAATHAALCGTRMVLVWQVLATASLRQCL